MRRSLAQEEAIRRRRLQAEAATLREGPHPFRPSGPTRQLRELPGETFEDIFGSTPDTSAGAGRSIVRSDPGPAADADGQGRLL